MWCLRGLLKVSVCPLGFCLSSRSWICHEIPISSTDNLEEWDKPAYVENEDVIIDKLSRHSQNLEEYGSRDCWEVIHYVLMIPL